MRLTSSGPLIVQEASQKRKFGNNLTRSFDSGDNCDMSSTVNNNNIFEKGEGTVEISVLVEGERTLRSAAEAAGAAVRARLDSNNPLITWIPPVGGIASRSFSFPMVLHSMIEQAERHNYDSIVSWQQHGHAFRVHDPKRFVVDVAPHFFRQTRFKSFQRQLSLYGFKRVVAAGSPDEGCYRHDLFVRGMPNLSRQIQRVTSNNAVVAARKNRNKEVLQHNAMDIASLTSGEANSSPLLSSPSNNKLITDASAKELDSVESIAVTVKPSEAIYVNNVNINETQNTPPTSSNQEANCLQCHDGPCMTSESQKPDSMTEYIVVNGDAQSSEITKEQLSLIDSLEFNSGKCFPILTSIAPVQITTRTDHTNLKESDVVLTKPLEKLDVNQSHEHTIVEDCVSSCVIDADILDLFECLPDKACIEKFYQSTKSNSRPLRSNPVEVTNCSGQVMPEEKESTVPISAVQTDVTSQQLSVSNINGSVDHDVRNASSLNNGCDEEFDEIDLNLQFDEIICQLQEGDPNDRGHH